MATVVPSRTEAIRAAGISGWFEAEQLPDARHRGVTVGAGLSESSLRATSRPSGRRATMSVNVPPRSIQNSQRPSTGLRLST